MTANAIDAGVELRPDISRVVSQLFLPGESTPGSNSRTEGVLARVLATEDAAVKTAAANILLRYGPRHGSLESLLRTNAAIVRGSDVVELDDDREILVGAAFTAEYAVEGAALCNPSAVMHPDQTRLQPGQLRVLVSLRSIGESHLSSIQFCEAIIGPGVQWEFVPRTKPLERAVISSGEWERDHFLHALEHEHGVNDIVRFVVQELPPHFATSDIDQVIRALPEQLLRHHASRAQIDVIRTVGRSSYRATFSEAGGISQRVLLPAADEERRGIEDPRFVMCVDADGQPEYRGTYTAYDGEHIASRLAVTSDFRDFTMHRLTGAPTRTKGMALFPRPIGGRQLALSRGDGEAVSLTGSVDGFHWEPDTPIYEPSYLWDVVQSGNCGSPLETAEGWLVLTHGVGPMRSYSIGALLLDLDDPRRVIAVLEEPLLEPSGSLVDGYVPSVMYSCGAIIHEGMLWIPYGVGDNRVRVASVAVSALLDAMRLTDA